MKKIIRTTDEKRGLVQITTSDERWYLKPGTDPVTELPVYIPVPSVTWIGSYYPKGIGYYKWLADKGWDEAEAIKVAAGDKGSVVHLALEKILNGEEFRIDTKVQDKSRSTEQETAMRDLTYEELLCVKSFLDWQRDTAQDYTIETLATEITLFSDIHKFAGTVDWVVRLTPKAEGKNPLKLGGPTPYVVDFKTSKQIWKSHEMQVSAYRVALENGENVLPEKNPNGTETGRNLDLSGLRTAILQVGYDKNKAGYKFTETDDCFDLFKISQKIWAVEINGNTPGFTQRDFPIVLSPARKPLQEEPAQQAEVVEVAREEQVEQAEAVEPPKKKRKNTN